MKDELKPLRITYDKYKEFKLDSIGDFKPTPWHEIVKERARKIDLAIYEALINDYKYVNIEKFDMTKCINTDSNVVSIGITASNDSIVYKDADILNIDILREKLKGIDYKNMTFEQLKLSIKGVC